MRGGKSLAERGVIPRLLSSIYRRSRKIEKDSEGETTVKVALSYYEIYNDKVFDLFEPLEKRTLAGLPLRDNGGKTVVVGLTEKPCTSLKEFESLYDHANINRSTSATKVNRHGFERPGYEANFVLVECSFIPIARRSVCESDHQLG
jgi:hypothetical protein